MADATALNFSIDKRSVDFDELGPGSTVDRILEPTEQARACLRVSVHGSIHPAEFI
jgi:hypothetical protein